MADLPSNPIGDPLGATPPLTFGRIETPTHTNAPPPSLSVVTLKPTEASMAEALETIDKLRAEIAEGRAVGFAGVTISADDAICGWLATVQKVSRLRFMGAASQLLASLHADEI